MRRLKVEFEVKLPDGSFTDEQIDEWLRFGFGDSGFMSGNNPLNGSATEPVFGSFFWDEA